MNDPGSVWLVTEGDYSDYHVVAAFTSEKKANAFAEWQWGPGAGSWAVESFALDQETPEGVGGFRVSWWENGSNDDEFGPVASWDPEGPMYRAPTVFMAKDPNGKRHYFYEASGRTRMHVLLSVNNLRRSVRAETFIPEERPFIDAIAAGIPVKYYDFYATEPLLARMAKEPTP